MLRFLFYIEHECSQRFEMSGDILKWLHGKLKKKFTSETLKYS